MAVSMLDFIYGTNDTFAEKAFNLVKCWRIGIKSCINETDLVVLSMYMKVLETDLTDYNITSNEVRDIVNSIINIFNITNVVVEEGDIITYLTNNTYVTTYIDNSTIVDLPSYFTTYSVVGTQNLQVVHGLNKYNTTVTVTDTSGGGRVRVDVGIVEINENMIMLSFASTSAGEIKVM